MRRRECLVARSLPDWGRLTSENRPVARTHARMIAALPKNVTATAHDALIAATAVHHGFGLLTRNVADFKIFAGVKLEAFAASA